MENTDIKYYVINTKMTSSIYIEFQKRFSKNLPCFIVDPDNIRHLHNMFYDKDNLPCKFLICGREISPDYVISYLGLQGVKDEDIIQLNMQNYEYFNVYVKTYGLYTIIEEGYSKIRFLKKPENPNDPLRIKYVYEPENVEMRIKLEDDAYYTELCNEFFYTFVKPLFPLKTCPTVKIIDKINGFMHLNNSSYNKVANALYDMAFGLSLQDFGQYEKTRLENLGSFTRGFGGAYILPYNFHRDNFKPHDMWGVLALESRQMYTKHLYKTEKDRYLDFLDKSKYVFCMYHDDKTNTCYVVKDVEPEKRGDFSYTIDGKKYCYLNGIKVPRWLYDTPKEELNLTEILNLKNADVRSEAIKKYGLERLVDYAKLIDTWENYPDNEWWAKSEYKIYDMHEFLPPIKVINKRTGRLVRTERHNYAPFLYMKNQTTGAYHLEGISPKCKNLYNAIRMRYNGLNLPKYKIENIK